jgi:gamma-glutamylcyclotransferase
MTNEPHVLVFAYGSNLCTQRMRSRVSTSVPVAVGYVRQRRFIFHKKSIDGSAKADAALAAASDERVWGVVYRLQRQQKRVLDNYEFLGSGYDEERVDVIHETGIVRAWMYVARRNAIDSTLLPYSWYHDLIVAGAVQHRLPSHYVQYLQSFEAVVDPDDRRHSANTRLIGR